MGGVRPRNRGVSQAYEGVDNRLPGGHSGSSAQGGRVREAELGRRQGELPLIPDASLVDSPAPFVIVKVRIPPGFSAARMRS